MKDWVKQSLCGVGLGGFIVLFFYWWHYVSWTQR